MFKKIALSGLFLSFLSLPLLAQQTTTPDAQVPTRVERNGARPQRPMVDPETRARKMTDRITKELGLDQTASKKVYDATLTHAQKVDEIRKNADDRKAKGQAMKANADDYKAKMQSILTADQFAKLQSMKERMHHGRGRHGARGEDKGSRS
ncbi:DUF4890 domain-containing protein [Spirosoma sp.]|uniref:DUF4890 domain-containing protein n=1 Tax=Spirosoma sp. TaxID=1899569 RepID=UPI003B3A1715